MAQDQYVSSGEQKDLLRCITAGSVDDGKSTLIGRMLYDSKALHRDQLEALHRDNRKEGHAGEATDYALLLDGLKAEREQGITIDVAYRYFATPRRKFIIADTPGHEQYTRNMVTGASGANLAIILVDARQGILTQTRRHTFLASLLGIRHIVLAVNKMDLVGYDASLFHAIRRDYEDFLTRLDVPDVHVIPVSALEGDNVVDPSVRMPWYQGMPLLGLLETLHVGSDRNFIDVRYPVQCVLRPSKDFRAYAGKVVSGIIRKGDELTVLPSGKRSTVTAITTYEGELDEAFPPLSVAISLADAIDISRGDMLVKADNVPRTERRFEAMLVWMGEAPMGANTGYLIKHTTMSTRVRIDKVRYLIDVNTLSRSASTRDLELNDICRAVLTTAKPLHFDSYQKNRGTGSFIIIDPVSFNTVGAGMIIDRSAAVEALVEAIPCPSILSLIGSGEREMKLGQKGAIIWLAGEDAAALGELASLLERLLFDHGAMAVLFDDNWNDGLAGREEEGERLVRTLALCSMLCRQGLLVVVPSLRPLPDMVMAEGALVRVQFDDAARVKGPKPEVDLSGQSPQEGAKSVQHYLMASGIITR